MGDVLNQSVFGGFLVVALALGALGDLVVRGVHVGVGADGAFPDIGFFPHKFRKDRFFFEENPKDKYHEQRRHHINKYGTGNI